MVAARRIFILARVAFGDMPSTDPTFCINFRSGSEFMPKIGYHSCTPPYYTPVPLHQVENAWQRENLHGRRLVVIP
jgi:hypothetical protein